MRSLFTLTTCTLLFCATLAAQRVGDYRDPDRNYDEGWVELFNGKNLDGWVAITQKPGGAANDVDRFHDETLGDQKTFTVEDGVIKVTGEPLGYLRTTDVYDNFVFHAEVRFTTLGNSGIIFHIQRDAPLPSAIECQLYYSRMGEIIPLRSKLDGGEIIHYNAKPLGEWNTVEVYSEEGRVATVVNGALVGLGANAEPNMGYISLQSEGTAVEFRNVRVKRFTPSHHLRARPQQ